MKPFDLFSNAVRAKEIAAILIRNGFADLLQKLEPPAWLVERLVDHQAVRMNTWQRIRLVLEELGPIYVKFGQILSMRPDALPEPLIMELRNLQDRVTPVSFEEMEPVLVEALGGDIESVFSEFEKEPVASASLAQVYFGRLRETGRAVAVKVQRPHIRKSIGPDFEILEWFARQAHERLTDMRPYNLPGIVDELRDGMERELDFRIEVRNTALFLIQNPSPEEIFAPVIFEDLSTRTVIVMERIDGVKLEQLTTGSPEAKQVAGRGARSIFHQILVDGFFHADPHSGNLVVAADGRVCFLDWGLVGQLTRRMRYTLVDLFGAFMRGDSGQVVTVAMDLGRSSTKPFSARRMERDILYALRETFNPGTGQAELGRAMLRLLHIFGANGIDVGRDYALVAKAVVSIEEAGSQLDPEFDLRECFRPAVEELIRERRNPREILRQLRQTLTSGVGRIQELPGELGRVLRLFEQGGATINFQHRGLEDLDEAINDASNKITLSVIIGSLIIGSSLIVHTGMEPHLFGYPVLGLVGYLLSALLGVWVVFDILRGGGRR